MAVEIKYVVVRNGKEVMTFTTKKEADSHDKTLDIAELLLQFLHTSEVQIDEKPLDDLTFFMARNRDQMSKLLKGVAPEQDNNDLLTSQSNKTELSKKPAKSKTSNSKSSNKKISTEAA